MIFDVDKIVVVLERVLSLSMKFKYMRDIVICEQNMATTKVKKIISSADVSSDFLVL